MITITMRNGRMSGCPYMAVYNLQFIMDSAFALIITLGAIGASLTAS